jgi:hypothetical protein
VNKNCKFKTFQVFFFQKLSKSRKFATASNENRALSEIKILFIAMFFFGVIRTILVCFTATNMFEPKLSVRSIDSRVLSSHGLALKAYNLDVKAPTGHKSITLPEILDFKILET